MPCVTVKQRLIKEDIRGQPWACTCPCTQTHPDTHECAHMHANTAYMYGQRSQWEAFLRFMLHKTSCFGTLMGKMWESVCSSTFSSLCLSLSVSLSLSICRLCHRPSSTSCSSLLSYDVLATQDPDPASQGHKPQMSLVDMPRS